MAVTTGQPSSEFFEQALRWRERQYATLAELALLAIRHPVIDTVLDTIAEQLRLALDADFSKVLDQRAGVTGLFLRAGAGWPDGVVGEREVPEGYASQSGYTLLVDEPVIVTDFPTETRFVPPPLLVEFGVRSGISVVIRGDGRTLGVLQADKRQPDHFGPDDIPVLQAYADVLGEAIAASEREEIASGFAELAAHELRTPLTVIVGHAERLRRATMSGAAGTDDEREAIAAIHEESLRLERTVELFLAFGDAERRARPIRLEEVDVVDVIDDVIGAVTQRFPDRVIKLRANGTTSTDLVDEVALSRIVSNLVENASKFSPAGAEIGVSVISDDGPSRIEIVDACGGMSEHELRRLFEWSFQGTTGADGRREGLGLGLYVARRLSERLGWLLTAENRGAGCAFTLRLGASDAVAGGPG